MDVKSMDVRNCVCLGTVAAEEQKEKQQQTLHHHRASMLVAMVVPPQKSNTKYSSTFQITKNLKIEKQKQNYKIDENQDKQYMFL
jgi:hypothetical protein